MEGLVADLGGVFKVGLDELPFWYPHSTTAVRRGEAEESPQEELDCAAWEELIKTLLRVGTG